jgi:hypothetical protein
MEIILDQNDFFLLCARRERESEKKEKKVSHLRSTTLDVPARCVSSAARSDAWLSHRSRYGDMD